ncbi:3,4-dioxygenase subunit beta [Dietzia sp. NCCP-2495]|uniref:dioxygenase family protein n=1 Tax=Dietzia sp. NCCP-2495 TaxID=2934675 RepID=UPI002232C855|nr:3,4-dioxygenase subunit beta [Dietzia sp. NCCP-2495]GLB64356.1 3,4-dioxygenase subunit beta [Dietzia sp. NCCP-2495]
MNHVPEADRTPDGPVYEGRLLARPDDELVDQGAAFDATTLVTRRRMLGLVGAGVGAVTLAACYPGSSSSSSAGSVSGSTTTAASGSSIAEIPEETNGPYPADGTNGVNVLQESGIVRSDLTSSLDGGTTVEGVPFELTFVVTDMANGNVPFAGAAVYAWQCDAQGLYSMYSQGAEDETYLRGIQVADTNGELTFKTIVPGCYTGRWAHIHFEVYPDEQSATEVANVIATSQLAFPPEMLTDIYALDAYAGSAENLAGVGAAISDDGIFAEGDWSLQVPTITGDITSGYVGRLAVGVDTTTEATSGGGGMPPGGGGGGTPPGGGGGMPPGGGTPPNGGPPSN